MALVSSQQVWRHGRHHVPVISLVDAKQKRHSSYDVVKGQYDNLAAYKRGTGGKSSFSGIVATVFGNTGHVGTGIVSRLGKIGSQVICPYREAYRVRDNRLAGDLGQILFMPWDLRDEDSIRKAMKYSNVVINCMGQKKKTINYPMYEDMFVHGAEKIARIAKESGVQRLIHFSNIKASHDPPHFNREQGSESLIAQQRGEDLVREIFPEATIIRPSNIFAHYSDTFGRWLMHNNRRDNNFLCRRVSLYDAGRETRVAPVFRGDVLTGVAKIVQDPTTAGKVYEFFGPKEYTLEELFAYFKRVFRVGNGRILTDVGWRVDRMSDPTKPDKIRKDVSCDLFERESTSDIITQINGNNLESLGVTLTQIEFVYHFMSKHIKDFRYRYDIQMENIPAEGPKVERWLAQNAVRDAEYLNPIEYKKAHEEHPVTVLQ